MWGDGGLSDRLVESGVYASCTVEQMLSGKQFNRAVRSLTLAYEATMSLWLSSFFDWCQTNDHFLNIPDDIWHYLLLCHGNFADKETFLQNKTSFLSLHETYLSPLMEEFRKFGCAASATFQYWDMFLEAVGDNSTVHQGREEWFVVITSELLACNATINLCSQSNQLLQVDADLYS